MDKYKRFKFLTCEQLIKFYENDDSINQEIDMSLDPPYSFMLPEHLSELWKKEGLKPSKFTLDLWKTDAERINDLRKIRKRDGITKYIPKCCFN
tara:strand:+ start:6824 stop:7105 length:282 start_codon:yes stop_codon:yes gene_type:complete